jgi:hypothetical protein
MKDRMIRILPNLFRFVAVPILALVVLLLVSAPARAGCGEPMLTLNHSEPEAPPKPCEGPNCSASPQDAPSPAPTTSWNSAPNDWAVAMVDSLTLRAAAAKPPLPVSFRPSVRISAVPFDPPRDR